jgi:hypothetical protein
MLQQHRRSFVLTCVAVISLSSCFTGERATLVSEVPIDDPAAQMVLDRLALADSVDFIATYDITPSLTGATTQATVVQQDGRRRITIGSVDYVTDGNVSRTCLNNGEECSDYIDDARVSDLNITHSFWGSAFASRLELDASRRIGPSTNLNTDIAGQPSVCVDVIVPSVATATGTVTYCGLDAGVLGRYFGADVSIEMTSFSFQVVPSDFGG